MFARDRQAEFDNRLRQQGCDHVSALPTTRPIQKVQNAPDGLDMVALRLANACRARVPWVHERHAVHRGLVQVGQVAPPSDARTGMVGTPAQSCGFPDRGAARTGNVAHRSEEHTSELQSLMRISYAVFCLKKKTTNNTYTIITLDV